MKKVGYILLAVLVGILMPFTIWAAAGSALYSQRQRSKLVKKALSSLVCKIDVDCPPGYICVDGRCIPEG